MRDLEPDDPSPPRFVISANGLVERAAERRAMSLRHSRPARAAAVAS